MKDLHPQSNYQVFSNSKDAWNAMYQELLGAQKSIYWELYIFLDDETGKHFFDLLQKKAKEGVEVKIVIDFFGSFAVGKKRIQALKKSGVDLLFFSEKKHRYRNIWKLLVVRTHRKCLIIDEEVGFIGGVNIEKRIEDWLDIHVRIEGEAVRSLLRAFAKSYIISGGEKKNVKHLLKYPFRVKKDIDDIQFIYDEADDGKKSRAKNKYTEALLKARERVIFFSPYYFPDKEFIFALWKARKRGIKIDLLIPFRTDIRIATYAAYGWFSLMRKMGVTVHLSPKMMHGKGVVVDDDWAMVGSSNLEHGSFFHQYEANVELKEKGIVKKIKDIAEEWMSKSNKLDESWEKRGVWNKIKEAVSTFLYRIWNPRD